MCFTLHPTINWIVILDGKAFHLQLTWPLHMWHHMKKLNWPSSIPLKKRLRDTTRVKFVKWFYFNMFWYDMIWMTRNHIIRQNEREVIDPLFLSRKTNKIYTSHLMSQDYASNETSRSNPWNPSIPLLWKWALMRP